MNIEEIIKIAGRPPHCDSNVLHRKGICDVCDELPVWQALRELWGINFTGENDPTKLPCPAETHRSAELIHCWPGNRPNGQ